jgi:hypothetical protein
MSLKNPVEIEIYNIIMKDIESNIKNYSSLSNIEIGKRMDKSPNTVRDKIVRMVERQYLQSKLNYWDEDKKFYSRIMLKGNVPK